MTHTPGPWKAIQYGDTDGWRIEAPLMGTPQNAYNVAYIARRDTPNQPVAANARLIAAAPDQNDALTYLADWLGLPLHQNQRCHLCEWSHGEHRADCPTHKVMAAIAKAKQEEEEKR